MDTLGLLRWQRIDDAFFGTGYSDWLRFSDCVMIDRCTMMSKYTNLYVRHGVPDRAVLVRGDLFYSLEISNFSWGFSMKEIVQEFPYHLMRVSLVVHKCSVIEARRGNFMMFTRLGYGSCHALEMAACM